MILRRRRRRPDITLERQPDALPKVGLFTEPVRVERLEALEPEEIDGEPRVTFLAEIRDAEGRRCPDFAVSATLTGPDRTARVQGTTDMLGRIRFRMRGDHGTYVIEVTDVAAGGMAWDADGSARRATCEIPTAD